ncbi:TPM domain-containing protein [Luethyella okanaganae]|uniref:TPM domain-containing protein n=1 Tax=Luethyella okanaganae TaxID=69372 RepID=A0ABW1VLE2_9MICO
MRARWALGAAIAVVLIVAEPVVAWAEDPVQFGSSPIVDSVGALDGKTGDVEQAISKLYADDRMQLFVVYVDTFSNPADAGDWANTTAEQNGLGDNDYLLVVALEGRNYQFSVAAGSPLTDEQITDITVNRIEPRLVDGDWAGATIAAAEGLHASRSGTGGGGTGFFWFILIAAVAIGLVVFFVVRGRRRKPAVPGGTAPVPGGIGSLSTKELKQRAGSALVRTDDAVKTSEEELGFAVASYGVESTTAFQSALDNAKALLSQGFTLQQKLDDSEPDSEEQRRAWYAQIVEFCERANAGLDEQAVAFDELRALEKDIPGAVTRVRHAVSTQQARLDASSSALTGFVAQYTDESIATIADNPGQARDRLGFAATALQSAEEASTTGHANQAAVAVRAAEESVDQAKLLVDAIDRLGSDLTTARRSLDTAIADLRNDVATARALPPGSDASGAVAGIVASTEQTLSEVGSRLSGDRVNPLELMQRLEQANSQIDGVLTGVRNAQAEVQRVAASLQQTMLSARSRASAAEDFITARRGAVGAEARTRLAEAGRLLIQAESAAAADPAQALVLAQRADSLASQSIELARQDVGGFAEQLGGPELLGGMFGGGSGSSGGGNVMGAILGGILINSVFGDGGGRSRSGGMSGGGFSGPGSFGGSGTRSRRGGGGRF